MIQKVPGLLILIMILLLHEGCDEITGSVQSARNIKFEFRGYNLQGNFIYYGTMNLNFQDNKITGERNLKDISGSADTGAVEGTISSNGTFEINFDPHKVKRIYVSLEGNRWSSIGFMTGIIYSSSGTGIWSDTTGTFVLFP